jgi:hypothetical protein
MILTKTKVIYMAIQTGSFFRHIMNYHDIPSSEKSGQGITIINNNSSAPRVPKDTDNTIVKIALTIPLILSALVSVVGILRIVPTMLRPLNYFQHADAVHRARVFTESSDVRNATKNEVNTLTLELADTHKQIVTHNCSRAKQLLASAVVLVGSGAAQQLMVHGKIQPHKSFGDKEVKILAGASVLFGLLSVFWHTMMSPELHAHSYPSIVARAYPKSSQPAD